MLDNLRWLGHASFLIEGNRAVYIDPWKLRERKSNKPLPTADLILITHGHGDHLSLADIDLVSDDDTDIVVAAPYADDVPGIAVPIWPGAQILIGGVAVEAVASYNTDKPNHPQSAANVGYVVEMDGVRYYHAGDADVIPEMAAVRCDVALLPMGGKYTMDAAQAAEAAGMIQPKVVVPMHWGDIVGSAADVERMRALMPEGVELAVLEPER